MAIALSRSAFAGQRASHDVIVANGMGCRVRIGHLHAGETVQWTGACRSGFADGIGALIWSQNGIREGTFEGRFVAGAHTGLGRYLWPNGDSYTGEFSGRRADGVGTYLWAAPSGHGDRYSRQFHNGVPHGAGLYFWPNGASYEGEFRHSMRTGKKVLFSGPMAPITAAISWMIAGPAREFFRMLPEISIKGDSRTASSM